MKDEFKAEIDLKVNATYIVRDGKLETLDNPPKGFGEQVIHWQNGKPETTRLSYTKKLG